MPNLTSHQTLAATVTKTVAKLLALAALSLTLAACGQRGPLVPPTANTNIQTELEDPQADQSVLTADDEGKTPTKAPDEGFILDPLL